MYVHVYLQLCNYMYCILCIYTDFCLKRSTIFFSILRFLFFYSFYSPCSSDVRFLLRQSLLFYITHHSPQPSYIRPFFSSTSLVIPFPPPSFLHSVPLFAWHALTTLNSFPGLPLIFPPLSLSPSFFHLSCQSFVFALCIIDLS